MSTSLVYHTQGIVGFQVASFEYGQGRVIANVHQNRRKLACTACGSPDVTPVYVKSRLIQGMAMGRLVFCLSVALHRLKCSVCGA